jgi:predicted ATPase
MQVIALGIKHRGSDRWIVGSDISSGMLRTFLHLAELELSAPGTVIVIDEYENSMGVNCLPAVTSAITERHGALQFIITSHHPYVINNIPIEAWRLVQRVGGDIRVRDAVDIPALQTKSRHDAFVLLLNTPEFEEGMQ